jgi:hypothetical protein
MESTAHMPSRYRPCGAEIVHDIGMAARVTLTARSCPRR